MLTTFLVAALAAGAGDAPAAKTVGFFKGTYKEALAKGKEKKLPLFVDFYTDW